MSKHVSKDVCNCLRHTRTHQQKLSELSRAQKCDGKKTHETLGITWHLHGFTQVHLETNARRPWVLDEPHGPAWRWWSGWLCIHITCLPATNTIRIQKESIRLHTHTRIVNIIFVATRKNIVYQRKVYRGTLSCKQTRVRRNLLSVEYWERRV